DQRPGRAKGTPDEPVATEQEGLPSQGVGLEENIPRTPCGGWPVAVILSSGGYSMTSLSTLLDRDYLLDLRLLRQEFAVVDTADPASLRRWFTDHLYLSPN